MTIPIKEIEFTFTEVSKRTYIEVILIDKINEIIRHLKFIDKEAKNAL